MNPDTSQLNQNDYRPMIDEILRNAVTASASDVHIHAGSPPLLRIHTVIRPAISPPSRPSRRSPSQRK